MPSLPAWAPAAPSPGFRATSPKVSPKTEIVLADPKGSILADYIHTGDFGEAGSWLVEGIGEDFIPPVSDLSRVRKAYTISDGESFAAARALLKSEGRARWLVLGHAAGRGAPLLPRADGAEARRHFRLRFRQQVPLEDVRRPLDDGAGLAAAPGLWRSARPDCARFTTRAPSSPSARRTRCRRPTAA